MVEVEDTILQQTYTVYIVLDMNVYTCIYIYTCIYFIVYIHVTFVIVF